MIKCILINNENIDNIKIKDVNDSNLYKKCNYKKDNDFLKIKNWNFENNKIIELWGKNKGNSKYKNSNFLIKNEKLELYGKCIFVLKDISNNYISLEEDIFNNFFNINKENKQGNNTNNLEENDNIENDNIENNNKNNYDNIDNNIDDELEDLISKYENDELEYEMYCYSSEEENNDL